MRKRLSVLLAAIASMILILTLLFTAVQIGINDHTFINNKYSELGLARRMGMSNADLVNSCIRLIDYMQGKAESIDIEVTVNGEKTLMFDQPQEIQHMKDVRQLFETCKQYRDMGLFAMLVLYLLAAVLSFRSALHTIAKGYLWGAFVMFLFIGFIGTWAALDFSSFWTAFHQSLFWNDLWLFDPTTSRMINMLPETFFQGLVSRIVMMGGAAVVLLIGAAIFALVTLKKREAKARQAAQQKRAAAANGQRRKPPQENGRTERQPLTEEERRARAERRRQSQTAGQQKRKQQADGASEKEKQRPKKSGEKRKRPQQSEAGKPRKSAGAAAKRKKRPSAGNPPPRRKRPQPSGETEIDLFAENEARIPEPTAPAGDPTET